MLPGWNGLTQMKSAAQCSWRYQRILEPAM